MVNPTTTDNVEGTAIAIYTAPGNARCNACTYLLLIQSQAACVYMLLRSAPQVKNFVCNNSLAKYNFPSQVKSSSLKSKTIKVATE